MTQAEKIRQMTDKQLAEFLNILPSCPPAIECRHKDDGETCYLCWMRYLQSHAESLQTQGN